MLLLCVIALVTGCDGVIWSEDVQNGSTIHACAGNDVPLSWKYTLEWFEDVVNVEWYFSPRYSNTSVCTNRWSQWINRDNPSIGGDDAERMTSQEMTQFCPGGHVTAVQCQSIQGIPVFDKEEGLVCDVKDGFLCSGAVIAPTECNDYEIRYFCQCSGGDDDVELLATYVSGKFTQSGSSSQNLTHHALTAFLTSEAALTLHDVTGLDSGVYTVAVNTIEFDAYRSYTHSVVVDVVESGGSIPELNCIFPSVPPNDVTSTRHPDITSTEKHYVTTVRVPIG